MASRFSPQQYKLAKLHNCNIIHLNGWYEAYTGGNGTKEPVVDLCKATTLKTLDIRLHKLGRIKIS